MTDAYVLWDIDGTLLSTGRAGVHAWQDAALEILGVEIDLFGPWRWDGYTDHEIAVALGEHVGRPGRAEATLEHYAARLPHVLGRRVGRVLPGVREALEAIAARDDVHSLLLTGNVPQGARAKLAHYGLDHLVELDGGLCRPGSDRPSIAREALAVVERRAGVRPPDDRLLVIGDTPRDVACAQAIDVRCLAVATGAFDEAALVACGATLVSATLLEPAALLALVGSG